MKNILEKFEETEERLKDKVLYSDIESSITFSSFKKRCKEIATKIIEKGIYKSPIAILDNHDVSTLVGMFAIIYSGNHYIVLDSNSPVDRLEKICKNVKPEPLILTNTKNLELAKTLAHENILNIDEIQNVKINEEGLEKIRKDSTALDIAYILFTSGSTGDPKGTVITHANLLSYVEWFASEFSIDEKTIFAGQTPFYFSASVSDVYSSLMYGATYNIIPKSYFSFPMKLVEFMNERKVNTIYWVPSAMNIVSTLKLFDYILPTHLEKVMFVGEPMPNKVLNYWRKHLPSVMFANLFGPTETTDICTFYVVDRPFNDDDSLPIGKHCDNMEAFILNSDLKKIETTNEIGELYVKGPFVAPGYYNNEEQTKKAFVQNPLHNLYPDIVYKTGDLVYLNERGEFMYVGRNDSQIKRKGYRIELGEIERNASALSKVNSCAVVYNKEDDALILAYVGPKKQDDLREELKSKVPSYMMPDYFIKLLSMPYNANGKTDRKYISKNYKELLGEKNG